MRAPQPEGGLVEGQALPYVPEQTRGASKCGWALAKGIVVGTDTGQIALG
jgi:hypothetical protein